MTRQRIHLLECGIPLLVLGQLLVLPMDELFVRTDNKIDIWWVVMIIVVVLGIFCDPTTRWREWNSR